jgi:hypothetical protein
MDTDMDTVNTTDINNKSSSGAFPYLSVRISNLADLLLVIGIYVTVFINSVTFFTSPFEFYLGYVIYLILLPLLIRKYGVNHFLWIIFLILLINGIFMIWIGYNTFPLFLKVYIGVFLAYVFYDNVIKAFNYDIDTLFRWYIKGALIVSYIGLFQALCWIIHFEPGYRLFGVLNKWGISTGGIIGIRINSVFCEPTHLGAFLGGAFFTSIYTLLPIIKNNKPFLSKPEAIVITIVYILSSSGLSQGGVFITIVLFLLHFGLIRYLLVFIPILLFSFNVAYNNITDFRERIDGLIDLYLYDKFVLGKTHGSSFILYNNYHVATDNFPNNPLLGTGLGSHPVAFEKYSRAKHIKVEGFNNNSMDANSMLLRLISETGLFGTLLFLFFTFKGFIRRSPDIPDSFWVISSSCLVIILLNLFRQGHYFLNGFPLFFLLYVYNKQIFIKQYLS